MSKKGNRKSYNNYSGIGLPWGERRRLGSRYTRWTGGKIGFDWYKIPRIVIDGKNMDRYGLKKEE